MTFTLTTYQQTASDSVTKAIRYAQEDFVNRDGKKTAVGLAAPTGAGKTVIATDILERLLLGDGNTTGSDGAGHQPNPALSVLWITDDPALNRQTRDKMLLASRDLTDGDFIEIDTAFDAKRLEPGKIHFAHIQLFGKGTTSMQRSNSREYGLWEIVANTVTDAGSDFLLVIDEAHRGTGSSTRESATIVERLCHGGGTDHFTDQAHPSAPVIFGISATPKRFKDAMDRAGRALEMIEVPVADVRESGLLKDRIIVRHPGENQPATSTLLGLAVEALKASDAAWRAHAEATGTTPVEPLLVIQVSPGVRDTELATILTTLEAEWSILKDDAIAHSFDSHAALHVPVAGGVREVRYIAPDRIAGTPGVRVVLFKNALTTGWDCPRAEVMLSLRSASDYTNIAQLIGRMVRTPLAERIETDETLNWVTLFLPHYDKAQVAKVVAALGQDTGGDIEIVVEPVTCVKRTTVDDGSPLPAEVWGRLGALPSVARVAKPWKSETDRLLGLARLLRGHEILKGASKAAQARLVGAIKTEVSVRADEIDELIADVTTLDMTQTVWDNRTGAFIEDTSDPTKVATKVTDVEAQFKTADRTLPDATAKWYWSALLDADPAMDPYDAKAAVAALTRNKEIAAVFRDVIEKAASEQIASWRSQYANQVQMLGRQARLDFEAAWNPQAGVLNVDIEIPDTVSAPTEKITGDGENATTTLVPVYDKHLYVAPAHGTDANGTPQGHPKVAAGKFPAVLTGWEIDVLAKETAAPTLVAWYRNPPRSKHGLAIAYQVSAGEYGLLYPDFLFFHHVDDEIVVDVVDPHRHNEADTAPKWAGLARWAQANHDKVRRVVAVIKAGSNELQALDLTQDGIAERLEACNGKADIEALFEERGGAY